MTCEICHHGPLEHAVALYRVDGTNTWRCWYCLPQAQKDRLDPDMRGLGAIQKEQKETNDDQTTGGACPQPAPNFFRKGG